MTSYKKQLADSKIYQNTAQLKDTMLKFEQAKKALARPNDHWTMLAEVRGPAARRRATHCPTCYA